MASSFPSPEKALKTLQQLARQKPRGDGAPATLTIQISSELTAGEPQDLSLTQEQADAFDAARTSLLADLRFEYLREPDDQLGQFVVECRADRQADHVAAFICSRGREPTEQECYIPIEYLTARNVTEIGGIRFLSVDDPEVPPAQPGFVLDPPVGCVAAVPVRGTDPARMAERARPMVRHVLRVLRVTLSQTVGDIQVRFRPSIGYAFRDGSYGWQQRGDIAYNIELLQDMTPFLSQPVARLAANPALDIQKKAILALEWLERAYLSGETLLATLYRFFAMEALLGDTSEGLKSYNLALRQMTLSHMMIGGFRVPNSTLFLYDKIRSGAVHGEQVPEVTKVAADHFEWAVRDMLNQYLAVVEEHGITRRRDLVKMLDQHPDRPELLGWLGRYGGPIWSTYLSQIEGGPC